MEKTIRIETTGRETSLQSHTTPPAGAGWATSRFWWLILVGLCAAHGWLALQLSGPTGMSGLLSDKPIISGDHALHFQQAVLGAESFGNRGRASGYDPSFHAGYVKTPWFDAGSRPAELVQWLAGANDHPAAYKIGVAVCVGLTPILLGIAAAVLGSVVQGCLTALIGIIILWSDVGWPVIEQGHTATLLASLFAMLALAFFDRYHVKPGFASWLLTLATSCTLLFCDTLLWVIVAVAAMASWLKTAGNHRVGWHAGLATLMALTVIGNWFWLRDLVDYWWIQTDGASFSRDTGGSLAGILVNHPLWANDAGRVVSLLLFSAGCVGLAVMRWQGRPVALPLGLTIIGCLFLSTFGSRWALLNQLAPDKLAYAGALLAVVPACQAVGFCSSALIRLAGGGMRGALAACGVIALASYLLREPIAQFVSPCWQRGSLPMELPSGIQETLTAIQNQTTTNGRILWEEMPELDVWTPLLPRLTQRETIGGLGAKARIEHAAVRLRDGQLAGRPIGEWSADQLSDVCRIYNVSWIVCRTNEAVFRLKDWPEAESVGLLPNGDVLFKLKRPGSYFLVGNGKIARCDRKGITLTDLEPVDGQIVLSFHHDGAIRPSMDRIRVEKAANRYGAIPFIRLRVPMATPRVTLDWGVRP